jgi:hypothetical protein
MSRRSATVWSDPRPQSPVGCTFSPHQQDTDNPRHLRRLRCYTGLASDTTRPSLALFANAPDGVIGEPDRFLVLERFVE